MNAPTEPVVAEYDDLTDLLGDMPSYLLDDGRFHVCNEESATWVVDKITGYAEREARIKAQAAELLAQIKSDRARFERRFIPELELWFKGAVPRGRKSIILVTGTIATRTVAGAWTFKDREAATTWAREALPAAVAPVTTYQLDEDLVKAHAGSTGEVVPGLEWREERESFSVRGPKGGA